MRYILFSRSDVLIEVLGQEGEFFSKSEVAKLNTATTSEVFVGQIVKVYSLGKEFVPFCFEVGRPHKNIKLMQLEEHCLIEIQPERVVSGEFFLSKVLKNGVASLVGEPFRFNVFLGQEKFSHAISERIYDCEIYEKRNIVFVLGRSVDWDFCVVFHKVSKVFLEFCGDVEISESRIHAVQCLNTLAKHGKVVEVEITDSGFEVLGSEAVYLGEKPAFVPHFLSHIAFFEAVKVKDFNLAKTYLVPEFAESLCPQHFEEFFGEFEVILPLRQQGATRVALLSKNSEGTFLGHTYTLELSGNKIKNIF
ncbi:MAG: hypothetical protein IKT27_01215 [Clostridia bacterium]|nr:hypothetical protein [Clostridia bacterium]